MTALFDSVMPFSLLVVAASAVIGAVIGWLSNSYKARHLRSERAQQEMAMTSSSGVTAGRDRQ